MDPNHNRVAAEINDWKARETRLEKIFSPDILKDKGFLKEKLSFYDHLQVKYGRTGSEEEKITLRILSQQRGQLRAELYPNVFERLMQMFVQPVREKQLAEQDALRTDTNIKELKETMKTMGFETAADKLSAHIQQNPKDFSIPLSYYINENQKISFELSFSKQPDGSYRFDDYRATLQKENAPKDTVSQVFKVDPADSTHAQQAQNLLDGRAVMKGSLDFQGNQNQKWIQLDLNDKDANGNYKIKEFLHSYGFDLEKSAEKLISKEGLSPANHQAIFDGLRSGERQPVTIIRDNISVNLFIEANPQYKTVNIYDEHAKKISLSEALGKPGMKEQMNRTEKKQDLKPAQSKKNGVSIR